MGSQGEGEGHEGRERVTRGGRGSQGEGEGHKRREGVTRGGKGSRGEGGGHEGREGVTRGGGYQSHGPLNEGLLIDKFLPSLAAE